MLELIVQWSEHIQAQISLLIVIYASQGSKEVKENEGMETFSDAFMGRALVYLRFPGFASRNESISVIGTIFLHLVNDDR